MDKKQAIGTIFVLLLVAVAAIGYTMKKDDDKNYSDYCLPAGEGENMLQSSSKELYTKGGSIWSDNLTGSPTQLTFPQGTEKDAFPRWLDNQGMVFVRSGEGGDAVTIMKWDENPTTIMTRAKGSILRVDFVDLYNNPNDGADRLVVYSKSNPLDDTTFAVHLLEIRGQVSKVTQDFTGWKVNDPVNITRQCLEKAQRE